jgi:hypothetical protein
MGIAILIAAAIVTGPVRSAHGGSGPTLYVSPDTPLVIGSLTVSDGGVADLSGGATLAFGVSSPAVGVDAFDRHPSLGSLVSFDTALSLAVGGSDQLVAPGDVVVHDGSSYTEVAFRAAEFGAGGANVVAVAWVDEAAAPFVSIALAFDVPVTVHRGPGPSLHVETRDLLCVRAGGDTYNICLDGSALEIPARTHIDAADIVILSEDLLGPFRWYLSFSESGTIGGLAFDDEDVVEYRGGGLFQPGESGWGIALNNTWGGADLDAFAIENEVSPTPTTVATATHTPTATLTRTATPSSTITVPTSTATRTATPTGTATRTSTATSSPTGTVPTGTPTATQTNTGTVPTDTPTATQTNTGTVPTDTPTATQTNTGTVPTNTPTATATQTSTGTVPTNTPIATPTGTGVAACACDCDGDGRVTISELIRAVNIALERQPLEACAAADRNRDGRVAINEIIAGVAASLGGCS